MICWVICGLGLTDPVLSDRWRPFLWIFPVLQQFAIGSTLISEDMPSYPRIYTYVRGYTPLSKDMPVSPGIECSI
jgi:hypothetical protein